MTEETGHDLTERFARRQFVQAGLAASTAILGGGGVPAEAIRLVHEAVDAGIARPTIGPPELEDGSYVGNRPRSMQIAHRDPGWSHHYTARRTAAALCPIAVRLTDNAAFLRSGRGSRSTTRNRQRGSGVS